MDKHRKIDSQDLINPDFATSTYYGGHSLTEDELLSRLRSDYTANLQNMVILSVKNFHLLPVLRLMK